MANTINDYLIKIYLIIAITIHNYILNRKLYFKQIIL
jgi:putative flippase GtrA